MHVATRSSWRDWRGWLLAILAGGAIAAALFVPRIAQDERYHRFADARAIAGIPNFWDVVSNLPFALVGIYGLFLTTRLASRSFRPGSR